MRGPFWFCAISFMVLFAVLLAVRARLELRRAELDRLYLLADEE